MRWFRVSQLRSSKKASTRTMAVAKLAGRGGETVVQPLIEALSDADGGVRAAAAEGLGSIGSKRATAALLTRLKDPDGEVRAAAAKALQAIKDEGAIPGLVETLGDCNGTAGWQAAQALKAMAWEAASDEERAAWLLARGDFSSATNLGSAAVEPLARLTRGGPFHRCIRAVESLTEIGGARAVKPLLDCLRNDEPSVRAAAAEALGQVGDGRAIEPLIRVLRDPHRQVGLSACASLGRLGDQRGVEPLIKQLTHPAPEMRTAAAEALGRLRDPQAVLAVSALLEDADTEARETAATALGLLHDERAIEYLAGAMTDLESNVRQAAARALRMIDPYWERSDEALKAIPRLQGALKHREYWVRHSAAEILNKLGRAQPQEMALFTDTDGGRQKRQAALGVLLGMLTDRDRDFRQAAAEALGRLNLADAIGPLAAGLSDQDRGVQTAVARSLETFRWQPERRSDRARQLIALERWSDLMALGEDAVDAAAEALAWNDPAARRRSMEVLVQIGGPRAVGALRGIAESAAGSAAREDALAALAILGEPLECAEA